MTAQHTPGPWLADGEPGGMFMQIDIFTADGTAIADTCWGPGEDRESRANVRLIAAAPDLLDAAVKAEALLTSLTAQAKSEPGGALKDLRAAIAKAVGATR
jgi:hypothetical protein